MKNNEEKAFQLYMRPKLKIIAFTMEDVLCASNEQDELLPDIGGDENLFG